ncbi:MAG: TIGR03936 family radical SAM-associated protein [Bacteroidota bacterium]
MSTLWRCRLAKLGRMRFLSHLDLMRTLTRAFQRVDLALVYSGGYHPHPLLSFGPALAVGVESIGEYFDVTLGVEATRETLLERINAGLPGGIALLDACAMPAGGPSLAARINAASYRVWLPGVLDTEGIASLWSRESIPVARTNADGTRRVVDLRPLLLAVAPTDPSGGVLDILGVTGSAGNLRPEELLRFVSGLAPSRILRTGLYLRAGETLVEPMYGQAANWKEILPPRA